MAVLHRFLYPVGQGGFASETIDDFTVVFDCGSLSHGRVESYIDKMISEQHVSHVNALVLSHFDKDHVNCASKFVDKMKYIKKVYVPAVPADYKLIYNISTDGAYDDMLQLFRENNISVEEIQETQTASAFKNLWEWIIHSHMTVDDWDKLKNHLMSNGVDISRISDETYIKDEQNAGIINKSFHDANFYQGSNAKGLAMISKPSENTMPSSVIYQGKEKLPLEDKKLSACFYSGDARYITKKERCNLRTFVSEHMNDKTFLLAQIPHHGSKYNSNDKYLDVIKSRYYFCHDVNTDRLDENEPLNSNLKGQSKLLMIKDLDNEIVKSETTI